MSDDVDEKARKWNVDPLPLASKLSMLEIAFATLVGQLALTTQNPNREIETLLAQIKVNMDSLAEFQRDRPNQDRWDALMEANFTAIQQVLRFQFPGEKKAGDLN